MKGKVKNNRAEYISRASLHHPENVQHLDKKPVEIKADNSDRYYKAVIDEDWYINFSATDRTNEVAKDN
jgi:hypothetical protein